MKPSYDHRSVFRILKGGKISLIVSTLTAGGTLLLAAPSGGSVQSGSADISQNGAITTIHQSTQKASINWQSFSIGSNETVNFNQPNASSITLNRVVGNESSIISGALNANGQVWILNSNGILFSQGASISTAGLVASTMNISDADFMAGNTTFQSSGNTASVINMGTLRLTDGGYIALLGKEVVNEGLIQATKGTVSLASGDKITLNFNGNSLLGLTIDQGTLDALVQNKGVILSDGGHIFLTTKAANDLLNGMVNNTGLLQAQSLDDLTGSIEIFAHGGTADVGGSLKADEGFIETSGEELHITEGTSISAGHWLIDPVNITIDAALASTLEGQLSSGDATITTAAAGADEGNIYINSAISWNANTLNLIADNDIRINALMSATGTAGLDMAGNIKVGFNPGEAGGFAGRVDMADTASLTINGNAYTIINNLGVQGSVSGTDLQGINGALGGYYALGSNIDASITGTWNGGEGFMPIGNYPQTFIGVFDGLGHTVSGLNINRPSADTIGLFGYSDNAIVRNTGLINATVTGGGYVGALSGYHLFGSFHNNYMSGTVSGADQIGGLVGGIDSAALVDSYATGTVNGTNVVGGLVGEAFSDITRSYTTATVNATGYFIGGLAGYVGVETVSDSYAAGEVNGDRMVGGLLGTLDGGTISNSYATGAVNASQYRVGGLVGESFGDITRSYATGAVNGLDIVGGLVGYSEFGTISDSYAAGSVSGSTNVGGFVGEMLSGTVLRSYWDIDTSGQAFSAGGTGLSTASMKNTQTFYDFGWDFNTLWGRDTNNVLNNGYLALKALHPDFLFKTVLAMDVNPTKVYDGTAFITPTLNHTSMVNSISLNGAINVGTYSSSNVSDYAFAFNGGKTINDFEILLYAPGTMNITPKNITLSGITADNKLYDGTTIATLRTNGAVFSGLISGDDLTLSSTGAFTDANIGIGKTVNLTNTFGGTDRSNYTITNQLSTTADILDAPTETATITDTEVTLETEQVVTTIINESVVTAPENETLLLSETVLSDSFENQDTLVGVLDEGVNLPAGLEEEDNL